MQEQVNAMKQWCLDHYEEGGDTMVECWDNKDYVALFSDLDGTPVTTEEAWKRLKDLASIYEEQQADARNSAF